MTNTIFLRLQKLPITANFSIAFFSILLIRLFWLLYDPTLENFEGRMISEATLEGFDITTRIRFFTQSIILFFITFFILYQIKRFWNKLNGSKNYLLEWMHIHYLSLFGLMLLFFQINGFENTISIVYILVLQLFYLLALFLKFVFKNYNQCNNAKRSLLYMFCILFSVLIYFIIQSTYFNNNLHVPYHLILISFLLSFFLLLLNIWLNNRNQANINKTLKRFSYAILPLLFIPFLNIISTELFFIFHAHGYLSSQLINFLILLVCLLILSIIRWKRFKRKPASTYATIIKYHLLVFIFSIAAFIAYTPIIKISGEMFELGNALLPIMELHKFGVIPTIEKFNSHMLSEIFFPLLYSLIHQTSQYDVLLYDFFHAAIFATIAYYFIYKYFNCYYLALLTVLCFPLLNELIPLYHTMAILLIFITNKFLQEDAKFKNYVWLFGLIVFMIAWRIDIGYPSLVATLFILLLFFFKTERRFFNIKYFFYALLLFGLLVSAFLIFIAIYRNIDVLEKLKSTLSYFSSAQTYGHLSLGETRTFTYKLHYFLFPAGCVVLLTYLIVNLKRYTYLQQDKEKYVALLFLIIYYLVNFQRGLVRHSLIEGDDVFTSSFIYLIIALSIYLFTQQHIKNSAYITLLFIMPVIIIACKVPLPNGLQKSLLEAFDSKIENFEPINENDEKINRIDETGDETQKKYGALISFFKNNLSNEETFMDFSNTPMLYFFTAKLSPSDFYQNPMTIHNDYLQTNFIKNLPQYNVPYLLFGKVNEDFFDIVDGVPNTVRHYKMAEYFYKHYQPDTIIDGYRIWKKITLSKSLHAAADSIEAIPKSYDVKKLPFTWGIYDKNNNSSFNNFDLQIVQKAEDTLHYFILPENSQLKTKNTLMLEMSSRRDANIYLEYGDTTDKKILGAFKFIAPSMRGAIPFNIRVGTQYNWSSKMVNYLKIKSDQAIYITKINLSESE